MNSLDLLQPKFKDEIKKYLQRLRELKIDVIILETLRSYETQEAYYAQGRKPLDVVNALRAKAKLYLINEEENKKVITWTMKSKHLEGLAIDIVPSKNGKPDWNASNVIWRQMASVADEFEHLESGFHLSPKDMPHLQWKE